MDGVASAAWPRRFTAALAFTLAAYSLYWVVAIVAPQIYRPTFLAIALALTFLTYRARPGARTPPTLVDWVLVAATAASLAWPVVNMEQFVNRAATPTTTDMALGTLLVLLVLEATRRTVGWILPTTAVIFLLYAYYGAWLDRIGLSLIAHRGYSPARLIGTLYMTLEGILGVPLDVAATYIILFTIYGAVLEHSGAGRFFVEWATAALGGSGHRAGPGRTATLAGYLLGAVSGSGVATTVMLGSVSWPMMRRAQYPPDTGAAVLAAAGIGAIIAPPAMGAAAFLIAEFLNISYFEVVRMAVIPAALYFLSILVMVELDARRLKLVPVDAGLPPLSAVTRAGWHHFLSVIVMAAMLIRGVTAFRAVFWAMCLAAAVSFRRSNEALRPSRLARALVSGALSAIPVVATTATAGIIVGVVTLTGLGLRIAGVIVTLAGNSLGLTVVYSAIAVWVLGLAVPVTASYIIAAVMIAPALTGAGVSEPAAHMFVFYYAVLSEVSPPTALSPFAAAAITGGDPLRTTLLSWKYALPAFVVPFVFVLVPSGEALLLRERWPAVIAMTFGTAAALAAIAWLVTLTPPARTRS